MAKPPSGWHLTGPLGWAPTSLWRLAVRRPSIEWSWGTEEDPTGSFWDRNVFSSLRLPFLLHRGTRDFRVQISKDMYQWENLFDGTLPPQTPCSRPLSITYKFKPQPMKYIRLYARSYYGDGAGLEFFNVYSPEDCGKCWEENIDIKLVCVLFWLFIGGRRNTFMQFGHVSPKPHLEASFSFFHFS